MNETEFRKIGISRIKKKFKKFLNESEIEKNTITTRMTDAFYILNNSDEDEFWRVVFSKNFEEDAKNTLLNLLNKNSKADPKNNINGYLSHLRSFRDFAISYEINADSKKEDMEAIKEFLLDINCLDSLSKWTSKFNVFDVLKISRSEIRHSNVLAWLLDPNENHGLGDDVIRRFIQYAANCLTNDDEIFEILLKDFDDFTVYREWHHIDILAVSQNEKLILCIENKIGSIEHDDQLERYKSIIKEHYPDYKALFIYLSPNGEESSDPDNWHPMSYHDVLEIIELSKNKTELLPEASMLINNYIEAIRRNVMEDEKLVKICTEIYNKHKRAIDLIIENKPDKASELTEIFVKWAKEKSERGEIVFDLENCTKKYTRFTTKAMSKILPDATVASRSWNTKNFYFYEIINNENSFHLQCALSAENAPQDLKEKCEKIIALETSKHPKKDWKIITCFNTKKIKFKEDEEYDEEKIVKILDDYLEKIVSFEKDLSAKI